MAKSKGFVEVAGGRLYYEMTGDGPAVVLGHAGIADLRMWDQQVAPFSERYTVVRYDVRGFGRSPVATGAWAPHDDVASLLDQLGIERTSLVSVSMSGAIAVDFAVEHPDRLSSLVLVGAALDGFDYWDRDPQMKEGDTEEGRFLEAGDTEGAVDLMIQMWVAGPNRRPEEVDESVRRRVSDMQRSIYQGGFNATEHATELDPPAITRLEEIRAATLVIVGDEDFPSIREIADLLASRIPGAQKAVMTGTAHVPNMERPDEFNDLVLGFLGERV